MWRSLGAVLAGYVAMAILVVVGTAVAARRLLPAAVDSPQRLSPAYLRANLAVSAVAAVVGGYVAAALAGRSPIAHGLALAALLVAMNLVSRRQAAGAQPPWYQTVLLAAMPLLAIGGALLRAATLGPAR